MTTDRYYQDFVGLNTYAYETVGWFPPDQTIFTHDYAGVARNQPYTEFIYTFEIGGWETPGTCDMKYNIPVRPLQNHIGGSYDLCLQENNNKHEIPIPLFRYKNLAFLYSRDYKRYIRNISNKHMFNALMTKRNGPYGYPSWKQIRIGQNPLTRKQRLHNIFTYVEEPGISHTFKIRGRNYDNTDRYGPIKVFKEPVVSSPAKPLSLIGGIKTYNERTDTYKLKSAQLQASFGNETIFFANDEINRYHGTIEDTDENYENFKDLYLDDGLDADGSPIDEFSMMSYRQTVWPKEVHTYLNKTRTRPHFVNKFWRDQRYLRTAASASSFGKAIPNQSIWPLDCRQNFNVTGGPPSQIPYPNISITPRQDSAYMFVGYALGGSTTVSAWNWDTGNRPTRVVTTGMSSTRYFRTASNGNGVGGAGILQNTYSHLANGLWVSSSLSHLSESAPPGLEPSGAALQSYVYTWSVAAPTNILTASCFYSRLHTLNTMTSLVSPSGMDIDEITPGQMIETASYFAGATFWDAPAQREALRNIPSNPFYDSYKDFSVDLRIKGKDYSIIPEFRISSHVGFYQSKGVTEELPTIFELSGALNENTTTGEMSEEFERGVTPGITGSFYKILSNSDFLRHFQMIKRDHEDFAQPAVITLKCKAIKKFLPYEGFYPAQRTVQMAEQFYQSHKHEIAVNNVSGATWAAAGTASFGLQPSLEPLFAPGVLFNTIKSGVAVDYPIVAEADGIVSSSVNIYGDRCGQVNNFGIFGTNKIGFSGSALSSMFARRIPFEALVDPSRYMAMRQFVNQEPCPLGLSQYKFSSVWSGGGDKLYSKMASNFLAEVPEFFLKDQNFTTISF